MTVGDTIRFLENTPTAIAGTSETMSVRSFTLPALIPQESPTALKPGTAGLRFFNIFMIVKEKLPEP
jgi:hypothetical protein